MRQARFVLTSGPEPPKALVQHASDLELAGRIVRHDRSAEPEFMQRMRCVPRYIAGLGRGCGAKLRSQDVEDLQQEVVYSAIKGLRTYRGDSSLSSWVFPICLAALTRFLRVRDRSVLCLQLAEPREQVSSPLDDPEATFERLMRHLSPQQAAVCRLRFIYDYTFGEIARELQVSVPTAKQHHQRALETLHNVLPETEDTEGGAAG